MSRQCQEKSCQNMAQVGSKCETHQVLNRARQARYYAKRMLVNTPARPSEPQQMETMSQEVSVRTTQTAANINESKSERVTEVHLPDGTIKKETNIQTNTNTTIWIQEIEVKVKQYVTKVVNGLRKMVNKPESSLMYRQAFTKHLDDRVQQVLEELENWSVFYQRILDDVKAEEQVRQDDIIEVAENEKAKRVAKGECPFPSGLEKQMEESLMDLTPINVPAAIRRDIGRDIGMLIVRGLLDTKVWKLMFIRHFVEDVSKDDLFLEEFQPSNDASHTNGLVDEVDARPVVCELKVECTLLKNSASIATLTLPDSIYTVYLQSLNDESDCQERIASANETISECESSPDFLSMFYPKDFDKSRQCIQQYTRLYQECADLRWSKPVVGEMFQTFPRLEAFRNTWKDVRDSHGLVKKNFPSEWADQLMNYHDAWSKVIRSPEHAAALRQQEKSAEVERKWDRLSAYREIYNKDRAAGKELTAADNVVMDRMWNNK
jgi:hypothetical protein